MKRFMSQLQLIIVTRKPVDFGRLYRGKALTTHLKAATVQNSSVSNRPRPLNYDLTFIGPLVHPRKVKNHP